MLGVRPLIHIYVYIAKLIPTPLLLSGATDSLSISRSAFTILFSRSVPFAGDTYLAGITVFCPRRDLRTQNADRSSPAIAADR